MQLLKVVALVALASVALADKEERACSNNVPGLWLDISVAIDVSSGMGHNGLSQVVANLYSVLVPTTIAQTGGQVNRVAITTYATNYSTVTNLTGMQSNDDLLNIFDLPNQQDFSDSTSNIRWGLAGAADALQQGRSQSPRENVRPIIILYASDYNDKGQFDPKPLSKQLIASGYTIITVAFVQEGEQQILTGLAELATPGMSFSSLETNPVGEIQDALCRANCFCGDTWTQQTQTYGDKTAPYGNCLKFGEFDSVWIAAQRTCSNLDSKAYLATEFSSQKHTFNQEMIKADGTAAAPYAFHIGLSYSGLNSTWQWEQAPGQDKIPLSYGDYQGWNTGYPSSTASSPNMGCVLNNQASTSFKLGWQDESCIGVSKRYLCQMDACDAGNYCADIYAAVGFVDISTI